MPRSPGRLRRRLSLTVLIEVVVIGLALYIILAGLSGLGSSLRAIRSAHPGWLALAMLAVAASYIAAATTYLFLSARRLQFVPTLWVELSGCLVNRLLPGGLGGLGINALYLRKQGQSLTTATVTVAANNLLGFVGNAMLLGIVFWLMPLHAPDSWDMVSGLKAVYIVFLIAAAAAGLLFWKRDTFGGVLKNILAYGRLLARRPPRTLGALLSSMSLTSLLSTALFCVLQAIQYPVSWPMALVAVSAGSLTGGLVPTPGGLGGAEAGIAAALIGLSVPPADATAAALTYRGITYWLPLLPGYLALRVVEKRYL